MKPSSDLTRATLVTPGDRYPPEEFGGFGGWGVSSGVGGGRSCAGDVGLATTGSGRAEIERLVARVGPLPDDRGQSELSLLVRGAHVLDPYDLLALLVSDLHGPRIRGGGHRPHEQGHPAGFPSTPISHPERPLRDPSPQVTGT